MKRIAFAILFLTFTYVVFAQNNQKRIALVIGNSAYQHGGKLKNATNDANLIAKTLQSLGFTVTKKVNANLRSMQIASAEFKQKIKDYDVALFFYAGHGIQVDGINYLIPVDAKLDNREMAKYDAFNIADINNAFMSNNKNVNIMILDACRNDPFRSWSRGGERGFAKIENSAKGTIIAFATQPGETADDGDGLNGLYTSKLVEQMKVSQDIERVFKKTRIEVNKASNGKQVPQDWSSLMADFYFVKSSGNVKINNIVEVSNENENNKPNENLSVKKEEIKSLKGSKPKLGITPSFGSSDNKGLKINNVTEGGPAQYAGIKKGDVITAINGNQIHNIYDYMKQAGKLKSGQTITVEIMRTGEKKELILQL